MDAMKRSSASRQAYDLLQIGRLVSIDIIIELLYCVIMTQEAHPPQVAESGLTPEQDENFTKSVELAFSQNEAFDRRQEAASHLAEALGSVSADIEEAKAGFVEAERDFELYGNAAGTLMPPRSAFEAEVVEPTEPFASESVWSVLTKEQKQTATEGRAAMVAQFEDLGMKASDVRLVRIEAEGKQRFFLAHSGQGIDFSDSGEVFDRARSHSAVTSDKNAKRFTVNGVDLRKDISGGKTEVYDAIYTAMATDARERGVPLPDSCEQQLATDDPEWTRSMFPGEPLTAHGDVRIRDVYVGGSVNLGVANPESADRNLRVRPVMEIE